MTPDPVRQDPEQLADLLRREAFERINLPYAALNALANFASAKNESITFPALKDVISTAEQLQITPAIRNWLNHNPQVKLQNQYGSTETHTVTATSLEGPIESFNGSFRLEFSSYECLDIGEGLKFTRTNADKPLADWVPRISTTVY